MDQREVERNVKALQKAINEKDSSSVVLSILEALKKDVVPTEELLRVRSLRQLCIPPRTCNRQLVDIKTMTDIFSDHQGWYCSIQAKGQSK